jgi:hypothetical protein
MLRFDPAHKSQSGKMIPIEVETGEDHQCPNSTYNKGGGQGQQQSFDRPRQFNQTQAQPKPQQQIQTPDYQRDLNEIIALLKEIYKAQTGKDWDTQPPPIQRGSAEDYKVNHGNELTGSTAGTGIDNFSAVDNYPEITEKSALDEDDGLPEGPTPKVISDIDTEVGPESVE